MQTIRVWFSKQGEACYISHLDLQRVVQRALKCAGAPVWYTQGFNPHIYLTFALPLPLGQQSLAESFDFKTERQIIDTEAIYWDLNRALPRGIRVYDVTGAKMGPGEIAWARYLVRFAGDPLQTRQKVDAFLAQKEILVEKRTKRGGMKQVDLAPHIAKKEWLPPCRGGLPRPDPPRGQHAEPEPGPAAGRAGGQNGRRPAGGDGLPHPGADGKL